jgi:RNA polymerase sigma-54 factor
MVSLSMRTATQQTQAMSPRLQHAVRLLQMSSQDFAQTLAASLGSNPVLETDDEGGPLQGGLAALAASASPSPGAPAAADGPDDAGDATVAANDAFDPHGQDGQDGSADEGWGVQRVAPAHGERDGLSLAELMANPQSLSAHLHGQLNVLPLTPRDMALAKAVVESLDDDGYLRSEPSELSAWAGPDEEPASADEVRIALRRVQSLDPAGVAARNVQECLALQAREVVCPRQRTLIEAIVGQHMKLLASRNVEALARQTGRPADEVSAACVRIRRFDPRPGWRFGAAAVQYVTPDVIARRVRGRWVAQLNPDVVPRVRLDRSMADLYQQAGTASPGMSSHLQEARWTLRNVEQRFATIVAVAQAILDRQHHFLDYGEMAMKPLGLSEIAAVVGAHESTVSRATNNKYIATPVGVFELKHFFSRAMVMPGGAECSSTAIRSLVRDLITEESPERPLSDTQLTALLAKQGLNVARRTVTKYRQLLKIDTASQRREGP